MIDESAREARFAVTLNRPSTGVVSMNYATVNGTALAGSDYVATSGSLSFAAGETAKTVTVTLTNDALAELAESFSLQISALAGATTLDALGTAVIAANDAPAAALPFITVDNVVAGEQDTYANFVVRLSAPSASTVTVGYNQSNGTAVNGPDYQALGNQVLTFAPGETVKTVQVNLLNDVTTAEPAESFFFNLFSATNAQIETTFARATIIDNDAVAGTPVVSVSDFVIDERRARRSFAVTLNRPSTGVVSMNYATVNGTALAGSDYVAKSGSLSFAPGETAKTVTVTLTNDALAELAESFSLQISALAGATTLDALGTAVIAANDAPAAALPFITVDNVVAGEQDTYANFVVRLSAPSASTVTVGYNQSNGTALNGLDYQALGNQVLTFAPGRRSRPCRSTCSTTSPRRSRRRASSSTCSAPPTHRSRPTFARATIVDNDAAAGTPVVSVSDFVIDESAREAQLRRHAEPAQHRGGVDELRHGQRHGAGRLGLRGHVGVAELRRRGDGQDGDGDARPTMRWRSWPRASRCRSARWRGHHPGCAGHRGDRGQRCARGGAAVHHGGRRGGGRAGHLRQLRGAAERAQREHGHGGLQPEQRHGPQRRRTTRRWATRC